MLKLPGCQDGFPNMFIALGPGGVSFSMQAIAVCEENTEWAARVISHMQEEGLETCDVRVEALKEAVEKNQRHADRTVWCVAASQIFLLARSAFFT